MEKIEINPFQQLYVSETTNSNDFVRLFSPYLVKHFPMLFQAGNVIVRGIEGSGKTMLLNLLKPEIRIAYHNANQPFPIKSPYVNFLSAGINLTRSDAVGFGQRPIIGDLQKDRQLFPLYFADFVNYWIVMDLFDSIATITKSAEAFNGLINTDKLDQFARLLSQEDCWFGYLQKTENLFQLIKRIKERIHVYRKFHQFNIECIPNEISDTKTSIGQPISKAALWLRESGVISHETPVFIRIDQLEYLLESVEIRDDLGLQYRRIINKALSTRDPEISYKIGARTYTWSDDLKIYGGNNELEYKRDYAIADLDEMLRRKENRSTWILPGFAKDVFKRRLVFAGYEIDSLTDKSDDLLELAFGSGLDPTDAANRYTKKSDPRRALRIPDNWPAQWKNFLIVNFREDPLTMLLACAWARQQGMSKTTISRLESPPPHDNPWTRTYWKKERVRQALLQLSANCGQRMYWAGKDQILNLSATNILIFISICQQIWDAFLRGERGKPDSNKAHPLKDGITLEVQSVGIYSASTYWYNKISEHPGGHARKRFVDYLGRFFRKSLFNDYAMSYPGHNGFSVADDEFTTGDPTFNFLKQAVNYGVLAEASHTTKEKDRRKRTKWYLNPVYSPHFGIPETHVKEPMYVTLKKVKQWLQDTERAGTDEFNMSEHSEISTTQLELFNK